MPPLLSIFSKLRLKLYILYKAYIRRQQVWEFTLSSLIIELKIVYFYLANIWRTQVDGIPTVLYPLRDYTKN